MDPMLDAMEAVKVALDPKTQVIDATVAAFRAARLVPVLVGEIASLRALLAREGPENESEGQG